MSTAPKPTSSSIPRPSRATSLAVYGPRPTKSSLLRASDKQGTSQSDDSKGALVKPSAASATLARAENLLAKLAAQRQERMVEQNKTGRPSGIPTPRPRTIGLTGVAGERRAAGHSGSSRSITLPPQTSSTAAAFFTPPSSSYLGSSGCRQLLQEVDASMKVYPELAQVSPKKSCVKMANSRFRRKKQVHWAKSSACRMYELEAGERVPWMTENECEYERYDGEIGWEEWREQLGRNVENGDELLSGTAQEMEHIQREEDKEELLAVWVKNKLASLNWWIVENNIRFYQHELAQQEKAELAKDEDSKWDIYIFGGNPMLEDEEMPSALHGDEVFDDIMKMMVDQEDELAEERELETEMAIIMASALEIELTRYAEEVKSEEGLTSAEESSWNLFEFGGNNPSLQEEPMPFTLPEPHPDTTFELGDLSVLPDDDMPLLTEQREPKCCAVLANIPDWYVPDPCEDDIRCMAKDLNSLAAQGLTISETDNDIWSRIHNKETPFLSTREEWFFETPTLLPFERKLQEEPQMQVSLLDEVVELSGVVCPSLDAPDADESLLEIDIGPMELGDVSLLPNGDIPLLIDQKAPQVCNALANMPEWFVPGPCKEDIDQMAKELNDLVAQGIPVSNTDNDIWSRLKSEETPFLSTKEECFFGIPMLPFERRFQARLETQVMLLDEVLEFSDIVCPALDALGADDSLLPIDTDPIIQRRLREPNLLKELAKITSPGVLCAALDDSVLL